MTHKFHGADYRHDHFVTPRRIDGYYPDDDKGVFLGRCALLVTLLLLLAALTW